MLFSSQQPVKRPLPRNRLMIDFVSQSTLDQGFEPIEDSLDHQGFAESLLATALRMPKGCVVALQGPWGRGKTDVLTRVAGRLHQADGTDDHDRAARPIWINPWQYGTPDLLTPLVIELLHRIPTKKRRLYAATLRRAAESLVRAGASFGLKATAMALPVGQILSAAAEPIDRVLEGLFSAGTSQNEAAPDPDPVAMMATRFRELVDLLLMRANINDARLVICVDDLDRCLPHRQVALLEALRFLGSSGAATTVLVALDPTLARQAVVTHYGTDVFDPDLYLDKMFHLRVTLPAMSPAGVTTLIRRELTTRQVGESNLGDWMTGQPRELPIQGVRPDWDWPSTPRELGWPGGFPLDPMSRYDIVARAMSDALEVQELRSPRLITRMIERIHVLANRSAGRSGETIAPLWMTTPTQLKLFVLWLAIGERWPAVRAAMQAIGHGADWGDRLREIFMRYWSADEAPDRQTERTRRVGSGLPAVVRQLPTPSAAPGLRQCLLLAWRLFNREAPPSGLTGTAHPIPGAFDASMRCENLAACWSEYDDILIGAGL